MEHIEECVELDCRAINMSSGASVMSAMLVKKIVFKPRVFSTYVRVDKLDTHELHHAREVAARELARTISNSFKYYRTSDEGNNRYEYNFTIAMLLEEEKIDFIEKVEKLEQKVIKTEWLYKEALRICEIYRTETLWQMIKRLYRRNFL